MSTPLSDILQTVDQTPHLTIAGLRASSPALLISLLAATDNCCCLVPDQHFATILENDLRLFSAARIFTYPEYETPPYTPLSRDTTGTAARLSTLYHLLEPGVRFILIVSVEALMRRTMPREKVANAAELIIAGEDYAREDLIAHLLRCGYEQVPLVQTVGDFSVRGGIMDIYPPPFVGSDNISYDGPIRLDFFGDTVESLRAFDPHSQRSLQKMTEAVLLPVSAVLFPSDPAPLFSRFTALAEERNWDLEQSQQLAALLEQQQAFAGIEFFLPIFSADLPVATSSFFDFLPPTTRLISIEPAAIQTKLQLTHERILANYAAASVHQAPTLRPGELFLTPDEVQQHLQRFSRIICSDFQGENETTVTISATNHQLLKQDIELQRKKRGLLAPLSDQIQAWHNQGDQVILCCRSQRHAHNLLELLEKRQHTLHPLPAPLDIFHLPQPSDPHNHESSPPSLFLCDQPLNQGFSLPAARVHLLSETELFGDMRLGGKGSAREKRQKLGEPVRFAELKNLDVIVHRDHGLGIYQGLITMEVLGITNDFMLIEYKGGDRLYLPVDRLHLISRYEGLADRDPKLDKLGTQSWQAVKSKVKEEVWKIAQELLTLYASREMRHGHRFSPPDELFHELEESFPFDETSGQAKAITETIDDLTSDQPMDRLVCGDVGYGKTEVAIRAAFKVVQDGFQVAILVPTTVLAEQHAKTFRERMAGFPVTVECINRFRSSAEQRRILKDLAASRIDILIGTHRLLSKDIDFANLGLLIVDEEHRFGVSHKEKIKQLKAEVDILTLTATPIPRTLEMSLLGIRDLSVISSPPERRQPVKTFVARYDDLVIKEAISKELGRQGQVFFVHNRIKTIHRLAASIQSLAPEARIAVAHGQMDGKDLEAIMVAFVSREIDILICTTIIESGLDIPSANTIIINRADALGLAEIYQLRGRVGRSATQSYAYLLVPSLDDLSRESKDRLQALMDCNELGGGFKLAMSDLQIRGGGNLLGVSQSGHIAAIGYELYLDLLQQTVSELKASAGQTGQAQTVIAEEVEPEINLHISAYIPESYIPDLGQRYIAYRRISALGNAEAEAQDDLRDELTDRYGALPDETGNLLAVIRLKKELVTLKICKLEKGKNSLVFSFANTTPIDPNLLLQYLEEKGEREKNLSLPPALPARPTGLLAMRRRGSKLPIAVRPPQKGPTNELTPDGRLIIVLPERSLSVPELFSFIHATLADLSRLAPSLNQS